MRKWLSTWFLWMLIVALAAIPAVRARAEQTGVLALGADLTSDQRAAVLAEMGLTEAQAASCQTIYITNDMEHQYLDSVLGASVVGRHALSSVLLLPQESGAGLSVETHNINYCTISMYRNALLTAGLQDAKVIVAAPSQVSGTAALIGAVKAYEAYRGETVDTDAFETATNELVLTGELAQGLDAEQVADLIAYLKQQVAEKGLDDPDRLEELVKLAAKEMNLSLTDEQVNQIVDLLLKLGKLDIDAGAMVGQAKELYDKLGSLEIDLDTKKVGNFITRFVSSVWELIQRFLSGK